MQQRLGKLEAIARNSAAIKVNGKWYEISDNVKKYVDSWRNRLNSLVRISLNQNDEVQFVEFINETPANVTTEAEESEKKESTTKRLIKVIKSVDPEDLASKINEFGSSDNVDIFATQIFYTGDYWVAFIYYKT